MTPWEMKRNIKDDVNTKYAITEKRGIYAMLNDQGNAIVWLLNAIHVLSPDYTR
jgi:hypothetical protein